MDINNCLFEGTVKDDPYMQYTKNGTAWTRLTLVIKRNEDDSYGQWVNFSLWNEVAEEAAEHLSQGDRVKIPEAVYSTRKSDKEDGATYHTFTSDRIEYQGKENNGETQEINQANLPF
jgi:single-stranded DNA-binding protein